MYTLEIKTIPLPYIMWGNASNNTPYYTHVNLYVVWRCPPPPGSQSLIYLYNGRHGGGGGGGDGKAIAPPFCTTLA